MSGLRTSLPEWLLASVVLASVALLIVPVPTALLDVLLSLNLAVAVLVALVALRVREPLDFASFPSLLLLTTLTRLALNLSTTRSILVRGDAGQVVRAFGHLVVQGEPIVGAVVFLVLTIIQFIVIAKGSERIAEVAARFTLDALPGKQLAIDAEHRAGALSSEQARERREALQRESQLYGAMDGAMKFVKGDAIAGTIIASLTIVAGTALGVMSRGLGAMQALEAYALLAIGDGILAQIPSLLIATAAGFVVTRVRSSGGLGASLAESLLGSFAALAMVAGMFAALALLPGAPHVPWLAMSAVFGLLALRAWRARPPEARPKLPVGPVVEVAAPEVASARAHVEAVVAALSAKTGVPIPPIEVVASSAPRGLVEEGWVIAGLDRDAFSSSLETALVRRLPAWLGVEATHRLVEDLGRASPQLARALTPKLHDTTTLAAVLRGLIDEEVPVRPFAAIAEALVRHGKEPDVHRLVEVAREGLREAISARLAPRGVLSAVTLDPLLEDCLRAALRTREGQTRLALSRDELRDVLRGMSPHAHAGPLLVAPDLRGHLRRLLAPHHPAWVVVSHADLLPETHVDVVATAHLG